MLRNGEEFVWWKCVLCCLRTLPSALIFKEKFSVKFSTVKMHSVEELGTNVPAFLAKLWKLVEDPETNDLICWSSVCNKQSQISLSSNHAFVKLIFTYCFYHVELERNCS